MYTSVSETAHLAGKGHYQGNGFAVYALPMLPLVTLVVQLHRTSLLQLYRAFVLQAPKKSVT